MFVSLILMSKGKGHPRTCHESPERKRVQIQLYCFFNRCARWGQVVMITPLAAALQLPTYITSDPITKLYSISTLGMMETASTKERNKGN